MKKMDPLWKRVIVDKYELEKVGWCRKEVRERHGVVRRLSKVKLIFRLAQGGIR